MNETFRIELLGFSAASRESAVTALVDAFGVGEDVAAGFVDSAPVSVRTGVEGQTAKHFAHQLLAIGADVRIVSEKTGQTADYKAAEVRSRQASPAPNPFQQKPAAATAAPAAPRQAPAAQPAAAAEAKTATCPACGFRQAPCAQCQHCGYKFPASVGDSTADDSEDEIDEDVDVFQTLRSPASQRVDEAELERQKRKLDKKAKKARRAAKKSKQLSDTAKRAHKIASQSGGRFDFTKRRRRVAIYVTLGLLALATVLFTLLGPSEQSEGDALPPDAIPAPPGFQYRAE